jgi:dTDP-4-amino-4,6-dideoxygalactose transaminase
MGVHTQIHYPIPCHRQAPYRRFGNLALPIAERTADEVLSLPMFPHLSDEQVARVCDAVHEALAGEEHGVA